MKIQDFNGEKHKRFHFYGNVKRGDFGKYDNFSTEELEGLLTSYKQQKQEAVEYINLLNNILSDDASSVKMANNICASRITKYEYLIISLDSDINYIENVLADRENQGANE